MRRHKGFTLLKAMKIAIAVGPVAADAANAYSANGGGVKGVSGAIAQIGTDYTGYNSVTGQWAPANLVKGYVPLLGAWAFGKFASRILRW